MRGKGAQQRSANRSEKVRSTYSMTEEGTGIWNHSRSPEIAGACGGRAGGNAFGFWVAVCKLSSACLPESASSLAWCLRSFLSVRILGSEKGQLSYFFLCP